MPRPQPSGRWLHPGTVSLFILLDKVEGAAHLGTVDFLRVPPCGCTLGYSSPTPPHTHTHSHLWLVLIYIACSQPWSDNFMWETPEANFGLRSWATRSSEMTSPRWDVNHLSSSASFLFLQLAPVSSSFHIRPRSQYCSHCVLCCVCVCSNDPYFIEQWPSTGRGSPRGK